MWRGVMVAARLHRLCRRAGPPTFVARWCRERLQEEVARQWGGLPAARGGDDCDDGDG